MSTANDKNQMKKKNIWISKPQHLALQKLATNSGLSQSEHIRRAIDTYLEQTICGN